MEGDGTEYRIHQSLQCSQKMAVRLMIRMAYYSVIHSAAGLDPQGSGKPAQTLQVKINRKRLLRSGSSQDLKGGDRDPLWGSLGFPFRALQAVESRRESIS